MAMRGVLPKAISKTAWCGQVGDGGLPQGQCFANLVDGHAQGQGVAQMVGRLQIGCPVGRHLKQPSGGGQAGQILAAYPQGMQTAPGLAGQLTTLDVAPGRPRAPQSSPIQQGWTGVGGETGNVG